MIFLTRDSRHPDTKCRRDGQGPEILVLARMQVHTYNEQDCTLNKNDHTAAVKFAHSLFNHGTLGRFNHGTAATGQQDGDAH